MYHLQPPQSPSGYSVNDGLVTENAYSSLPSPAAPFRGSRRSPQFSHPFPTPNTLPLVTPPTSAKYHDQSTSTSLAANEAQSSWSSRLAQYKLNAPIPQAQAPMLQLVSYGPRQGTERTQIQVVVNAIFPSTAPTTTTTPSGSYASATTKTLRILFGKVPVPTKVTNINPVHELDGSDSFDGLTMYADAPDRQEAGEVEHIAPDHSHRDQMTVPVYTQVLDAEMRVLETRFVGQFTYASFAAGDVKYPCELP